MEKRKIIKIAIWAVCILIFVCWMIVTGGELKNLKSIDENYEVSITVSEDHLEGYADDNKRTIVYKLTGEDAAQLRDLLINGIKARRLFGGSLTIRDPESNKRITIVANNMVDNGDFDMQIICKKYLAISDVTAGFLRNYHEELEDEVMDYLGGFDPVSDVVE
jgi:hypothetical protein